MISRNCVQDGVPKISGVLEAESLGRAKHALCSAHMGVDAPTKPWIAGRNLACDTARDAMMDA